MTIIHPASPIKWLFLLIHVLFVDVFAKCLQRIMNRTFVRRVGNMQNPILETDFINACPVHVHAIVRFDPLFGEVDGSRCPVYVVVINWEDDYVLGEYINL